MCRPARESKLREGRRFLVLILILVAGCATPPAYDPYQVPKIQIHSLVKTIALSPVSLPQVAGKADAVKAKIESLITTGLEEAGYTVIPSKEFGAAWDRLVEQMGGFFDPVTGKADEGKIKAVREHARREMVARFKAHAFLHPGIRVVGAVLKGSHAVWDGVSESIMADDWYRSFEGGTTQALSLSVLIEDGNGVDLYAHRGGIQLISKTVRGTFVNLRASEILTREEKVIEAIHIALNPFLEKTEVPGKTPESTNPR